MQVVATWCHLTRHGKVHGAPAHAPVSRVSQWCTAQLSHLHLCNPWGRHLVDRRWGVVLGITQGRSILGAIAA